MQSDVGPSLLHVLAGGTVCPCCGAPSTATEGVPLTRLNPPPLQAVRMRRPDTVSSVFASRGSRGLRTRGHSVALALLLLCTCVSGEFPSLLQ